MTKVDPNEWKLNLKLSIDDDVEIKERENKQYEIEYKAELDEALKRKRQYMENMYKAYTLLWEHCAKAMQNKLMSRSDDESKIYNDPITLLKAIKEHLLNYQETRYEMSIISDAFRVVFTAKQKENESLQDYTRKFKTARDILESHIGGPVILVKYVKTMNGYDENNPETTEELIKMACEQMFAFIYLENADQDKYGSILKNLNSQKSLGNDQYPKTIVEANNVMSNHKFDNAKSNNQQEKKKQTDRNQNKDKKEEEEEPITFSFMQMEGKCYCCGKQGHKSPDCQQKDKIPKEEWAINKLQQQYNKMNSDKKSSTDNSTISSNKSKTKVGWAGVHCAFTQATDLRELILLDSDSTDTIFCNLDYVSNIQD